MSNSALKLGTSFLVAMALAGGTMALPAGASAQQQPPNAMGQGVQPRSMADVAQLRLQQLHSELRITPAETPQWDQFARTMTQNAEQMDQAYRQRADQVSQMNAVQNMQTFAQIQQQQAAAMGRLVPVFDQLYASFTPEQKQLADQVFRNASERAEARHGVTPR